jgi:RNA polymerase sigma-70 factor (ECF subfamily)
MATRASDARAAVDRSFEQLYRGHHADVFRAALRQVGNVHDAEDVTQAAFVDAYRAVLRGSRPESPRAWLLAIAENVRRRRYRTAQRRPREEPIDADFPLAAELPHELAHELAEALSALPDEQRQVFVLRELGGLSYDEIAAETGATVGAIQMQLFRARRALREQLEPPTVSRRRPGLLVPLPGWLATMLSRFDASLPAARAAGALGAAAVAVAGTTVAVSEIRATPDATASPRPAVVTGVAVDRARDAAEGVRDRASTLASIVAAPPPAAAAPARRPATPARRPAEPAGPPAATAAATPQPVPAAVDPPASVVEPRPRTTVVERATRVLDRPRLRDRKPVEKATRVLERPRLPVRLPVEKAEHLLELPGAPELPRVSPLPTAPVPEAVTGAARAAGEGAQPPPAPGVPSVTVPPAP